MFVWWNILCEFTVMVSLINFILRDSLITEFFTYMKSPDIALSAIFWTNYNCFQRCSDIRDPYAGST